MSAADNAPHFDDHFVRGQRRRCTPPWRVGDASSEAVFRVCRHVLPRMGLPRDLPARVSKVCHGCISAVSRLCLGCVSAVSRLCLGYISAVSRQVCHGVVGRGARELPAGVVERLAARWAETMVSETGCSSYSELREAYSHERPLTPDTACTYGLQAPPLPPPCHPRSLVGCRRTRPTARASRPRGSRCQTA